MDVSFFFFYNRYRFSGSVMTSLFSTLFAITFFIAVKLRVAQRWVFTAFEKQSRLLKMLIVFLFYFYHTCLTGNEQPNMISRSYTCGNLRRVGGRLFYFFILPTPYYITRQQSGFSHFLPTLNRHCFFFVAIT